MTFYFFLVCPDNCVLDNSANSYPMNNNASDMRKVQILQKTHLWGNSNLRILKVVNFCNYVMYICGGLNGISLSNLYSKGIKKQ